MNPSHAASAAEHPGPARADRDPDLAAGGPGQELAERHEVGEGGVVEPAAPLDVLAPEVAEVRDRAAERRQPEPERDREDLAHRSGMRGPTALVVHRAKPTTSTPPAAARLRLALAGVAEWQTQRT